MRTRSCLRRPGSKKSITQSSTLSIAQKRLDRGSYAAPTAALPPSNLIVMIANAPWMIRVLTPIAIALFFIGYPPFHRLQSPKVVLVSKHLIYRVFLVRPSILSDALFFIAMNLHFGGARRTP